MERIPILRIGKVLLVTVQVGSHDDVIETLRDELVAAIERTKAKGVIIDVSALYVIDTHLSRVVNVVSRMCRLMDADAVLVGIRPAVAMTLVELGLTLDDITTALDVDHAIALLNRTARHVG